LIKLSVMYPNSDGATFDMDYYLSIHIPLAQRIIGAALKGISVDQGVAGQGPYLAMGHLLFESLEALQAAMAAHAPTLMADIPNYTASQPTMQVSEVKL
jgi:uncharacterized protein (TIGR02118 family)